MGYECRQIRAIGRVQGVFYRAFTRKTAQALKLTGWVRNEADGSVLLTACGEASVLDQLIEALKEGPPAAKVTQVQVESVATQHFDDFSIQRL